MKKFAYWFFAVVITLVLSIYQRMTGPTYPKKLTVELRGESYQMKLPRSGVQQDVLVKLPIPEDQSHVLESDQTTSVPMSLHYRRFPTSDEYTSVDFSLKNGEWTFPQRRARRHPDSPHPAHVRSHAAGRLYLPAGRYGQGLR